MSSFRLLLVLRLERGTNLRTAVNLHGLESVFEFLIGTFDSGDLLPTY